jgi:hypothetical protein
MSNIYIPQLWKDNVDLGQIHAELSKKAENSSIFQLQTDLYTLKNRVDKLVNENRTYLKVLKLTNSEGKKICDVDQNQYVFIIGGHFKKTDGKFYDFHNLSKKDPGFGKLRFEFWDKESKREYMVFLVGDLPSDWTGDVKLLYQLVLMVESTDEHTVEYDSSANRDQDTILVDRVKRANQRNIADSYL